MKASFRDMALCQALNLPLRILEPTAVRLAPPRGSWLCSLGLFREFTPDPHCVASFPWGHLQLYLSVSPLCAAHNTPEVPIKSLLEGEMGWLFSEVSPSPTKQAGKWKEKGRCPHWQPRQWQGMGAEGLEIRGSCL